MLFAATLLAGCGSATTQPAAPSTQAMNSWVATVTLTAAIVRGGNSVDGTVTLGGAAPAEGVTVTLRSSDAAATVPDTVTITSGRAIGTFTVTTRAVTSTTSLTISASAGGQTKEAPLRVDAPPSGAIAGLDFSPGIVTGPASTTGTIRLDAPATDAGVTVALTSSTSRVGVPASVTIPAGQTSRTFTVTTRVESPDLTATITASVAGVTRSATLRVNAPPRVPQVLSWTSQPGDFIGQGGSGSTSSFPVSAYTLTCGARDVEFFIDSPETWYFAFSAPRSSARLDVGTYSNVRSFYTATSAIPRMDVSGLAHGCQEVYGSFRIDTFVANDRNEVIRFDATVEQHCDSPSAPPLTIHLSFNDPRQQISPRQVCN